MKKTLKLLLLGESYIFGLIGGALDIIISFFGTIIIAIVGLLVLVIKTSKITVKDIFLKNYYYEFSISRLKSIIGLIFILISILATQI